MNEITTKQRALATLAHAGFYLGGAGYLLLPFIIWRVYSEDEFIGPHARQAFYMQLGSVFIVLGIIAAAFVVTPMVAVTVGVLVLAVAWSFCAMYAAVKSMLGETYTYPLLRLFGID